MKFKLLPVILILLFGFFATSALARSARSDEVRRNPNFLASPVASASATPKARGKLTQDEKRLRLCQTKEKGIQKRLTQLTRLVVNMEGKFDAIALRVENFYTNKVLTAGKTLPNYAALKADIAAKKALVDDTLTIAEVHSKTFKCDGTDPKGLLNQFRLDMQAVKKALHEYRTSIRNLIVAVHTLTGDTDKLEGSGTPVATTVVPTATPKATPVVTASPTPTPAI